MPDLKISQLTAATTPLTGTELVPLVQSGGNVKATVDNIVTAANATTRTVATGGTGLTATPTDGQLLIGNGTGYTLAAITAGSGITVTNGAGTITIAASGGGGSLTGQTDSATPFETSLGYQAGNVNTGINNTFVGYQAGALNTTGTDNTAVGFNALDANTTGVRNTAIGRDVLGSNTASDNSGLGNNALLVNTTGSQNAAFGSRTLDANTTGAQNAAFGNDALGANTTGSNNTAIGYQAGWNTTATTGNVLVGSQCGRNANGNYNIGMGQFALASGIGTENVVIGYAAASDSGDKYYSVVIGSEAGYAIKADGGTVAIGRRALYGFNSVTSSQNVAIGYSAASTLTSGTNNIVIGTSAQPSAASVSNEITLGNASITTLRCQVTSITALSDARDKTDIAPLSAGLSFVNALNPVAFTWNMRDGGKVGQPDTGFIAQELKAAQEETGINIPGLVYESNPERLEAAYGKLIPVLVKAIQELSAKVAELEAKVN